MKPISKKDKLIMLIVILVLVVLVSLSLYLIYSGEVGIGDDEGFVIEVIDGDTFKMSNGEVVRLLCVDTPEKGEKGYEQAKMFLENLILSKKIRLEEAESMNKTDKYGRRLAFVYVDVSEEEESVSEIILVNKLIIDLGFSEVYDYEGGGECFEKVG